MASQYDTKSDSRVRISAGTAFKAGFFGALGVAVLYLLLTIVLGIIALVLAAAGLAPAIARYFSR